MSVPTLPVSILHIRGEGSAARVRAAAVRSDSALRSACACEGVGACVRGLAAEVVAACVAVRR